MHSTVSLFFIHVLYFILYRAKARLQEQKTTKYIPTAQRNAKLQDLQKRLRVQILEILFHLAILDHIYEAYR